MSFAITDEEKAAGKCLICQSKPLAPTLVSHRSSRCSRARREDLIAPVELTAQVSRRTSVTPSVRRLVIALPRGVRFRFRAGMNVEFMTPGLDQPRPYSMANAPRPTAGCPTACSSFFVTRHDRRPSSGWLHGLAVGDELALARALRQTSTCRTERPGPACCAWPAARACRRSCRCCAKALADGLAQPVELLLSVRDRSEIFGVEELAALARRHGNFAYRITLTREAAASDRCLRGRVPDVLARESPDLSGAVVLIAGARPSSTIAPWRSNAAVPIRRGSSIELVPAARADDRRVGPPEPRSSPAGRAGTGRRPGRRAASGAAPPPAGTRCGSS